MIDKVTFIICLIKLLALQIILVGFFLGVYSHAPIHSLIISCGSLVFAIASNVMLFHILYFRRKHPRG
ncbi:hypothetical protein LCGC14_0807920 [marine sediment metagenome]|uniref:Uncharacterized protein n=1 Tax=marine sediment metagenome TaxID=412755 RepID=A0A0F9SV34_9ZZZZ